MKGNTSPTDFRIKGRIPFIARCVVHPHLSFGRHTMNHGTTYLNRKRAKSMKKPLLHFTLFLMYLTLPLMAMAQVVDIPDPNLRAAIESDLRKPAGATITVNDMAILGRGSHRQFYAAGRNISNLTGLQFATNLKDLDLSNNSISDVWALAGLSNLWRLSLSNNSISDISALTGLINLNDLDLSNNNISDISVLTGLARLNDLDLSNNNVSDISVLTGLAHLNDLDLSNNSISDVWALAGLARLNDLDLSNNSISDISALTGLINLNRLDLSNNNVSDISVLTGLARLNDLDLSNNNISALAGVSLSSGYGLAFSLDLSNNNISGLAGLTLSSTGPLSLDLSNNNISALAGVSLRGHGLTFSLDLSNNSVSDISALAGLTSLGNLNLDNNSISDISTLAELTFLSTLDLSNNNISDISALARLTSLGNLNLSNNSISDISALAGLTHLENLNLDNNVISDLFPLLANTRLGHGTSVSVAGNPLGDVSINTHIPTLRGRGISGLFQSQLLLPLIAPVAVGQRFTLDLTIKNVSDLAGWQLDLAFNPAGLLKAISVSEGDFLSTDGGNTFFQEGDINNAAGTITGISGVVIDTGGVSGSGTLFSVTFEARAAGEGWLRVSEDRLGAANGNQIHCETVIQPVIVGLTYDLNADGKVDLLDLTLVAQNFGKANPQADANHDGGVNVFDLIAVAQHIGESAAPQAPMVRREQRSLFPIHLLPKTVQNWIDMAHAADDGSLAFRQGIANLKQLLAAMVPDKTALLTNYPNPSTRRHGFHIILPTTRRYSSRFMTPKARWYVAWIWGIRGLAITQIGQKQRIGTAATKTENRSQVESISTSCERENFRRCEKWSS